MLINSFSKKYRKISYYNNFEIHIKHCYVPLPLTNPRETKMPHPIEDFSKNQKFTSAIDALAAEHSKKTPMVSAIAEVIYKHNELDPRDLALIWAGISA